jgi:hypothetical protein
VCSSSRGGSVVGLAFDGREASSSRSPARIARVPSSLPTNGGFSETRLTEEDRAEQMPIYPNGFMSPTFHSIRNLSIGVSPDEIPVI